MLKIWKYLLFSIVFITTASGEVLLTWGGYSKLDITKNEVDAIIKNHIDTTYPEQVKEYNKKLATIKESKIQSVADITFVQKKLMWQDTPKNTTVMLNQLEFKRYCKGLNLAKRKDWRVPTYKELLELVDYSKANPATKEQVKHIAPSEYWSNTQKHLGKKQREKNYWYVDFSLGESNFGNEMEKRYIRCVRELSLKKDNY